MQAEKKESSGYNQLFPLDKPGETGCEKKKKARKRTKRLMKISTGDEEAVPQDRAMAMSQKTRKPQPERIALL